MSHLSDSRAGTEREEIAKVASDLEITSSTITSLVQLAERILAEEIPGIETLIQVTARYTADLAQISQRLLELNKQ